MPKGKKNRKKFISKENAVTFHLVHRSQQDPLIVDETAPQHVLVPQQKKKGDKDIEEEHKYGIFFDDDYNYLQHLRGVEELETHWEEAPKPNVRVKPDKPKKISFPSSVFASSVEEPIGMLNKAAPESGLRLDLDPDIVAAMDEDFDFEDPDNQLEDDFVAMANQSGSEEDGSDYETDEEEDAEFGSEEGEGLGSMPDFGEVETKSRFTDYSLSSSVIRRNDQLTLLDDRFEKLFETYDHGELGALDCDEIEGEISTNDKRLLELADEHARKQNGLGEVDLKEKILSIIDREDYEDDEYETIVVEDKKDKWDCESILSTYSNIYNHPAKIVEPKGPPKIRLDKSGVVKDVLEGRKGPKLTARNLAALDESTNSPGPRSIISMVSELSNRPKGETPEQRRERKANLREYRRERRAEKKANTEAFAQEKVRQEKILMNLKNNLQGMKIL